MAGYGKWIIAALSLSLMINVFAAGHFVGQGVRSPAFKDASQASRGLPRGAFRAMPAEAQAAFRASLKDARQQTMRNRRQVRALRAEIPQIIARPGPLDTQALGENFQALRALNAGLQSRFETALLSALEVMNESERQAFSEQLKQSARRGPPRRMLSGDKGSAVPGDAPPPGPPPN